MQPLSMELLFRLRKRRKYTVPTTTITTHSMRHMSVIAIRRQRVASARYPLRTKVPLLLGTCIITVPTQPFRALLIMTIALELWAIRLIVRKTKRIISWFVQAALLIALTNTISRRVCRKSLCQKRFILFRAHLFPILTNPIVAWLEKILLPSRCRMNPLRQACTPWFQMQNILVMPIITVPMRLLLRESLLIAILRRAVLRFRWPPAKSIILRCIRALRATLTIPFLSVWLPR